jgi:mannose-6-phosphate isomerase-like protein (cupin superfamily)
MTEKSPRSVINLDEKFRMITDYFTPRIIAEHNGHHVKITKVKGEFVWHDHEKEDELFIVLKGRLTIQFRDGNVVLNPGDMYVIPRGEEHCPAAEEETHILYIEPASAKHSGDVASVLTKHELEWI